MADYTQYDPKALGAMLKAGGGMYVPPVPVTPSSQVTLPEQYERLDKALSTIHDQLSVLEDRIQGVLTPSGQETTGTGRAAPNGPWVLARTIMAAESAEAMIQRLIDIQKRLVI